MRWYPVCIYDHCADYIGLCLGLKYAKVSKLSLNPPDLIKCMQLTDPDLNPPKPHLSHVTIYIDEI